MADITLIIYWCYIRSHTKPVLLVEEGFGIDRLVSETPNWYDLQYYQDGSQYTYTRICTLYTSTIPLSITNIVIQIQKKFF